MTKDEILDEIRRIAAQDGGRPPGSQRVESLTGLRKVDWYPKCWLRWSDALRDAGFEANKFGSRFDPGLLLAKYIELTRELGRFPIEGDLEIKRYADKSFPSRSAFKGLGGKQDRIAAVLKYCQSHKGYDDVAVLCAGASMPQSSDSEEVAATACSVEYVYMLKHGSRNEYKIGKTINPIRREGEIAIELPERIRPIHVIKTDDPTGIEDYWHRRFAREGKSLNGEWFKLSATDVRAFKRWTKVF
jgi:hypothetical protein